jgi:uncharacterized protein involved in cysteine biosynthesis
MAGLLSTPREFVRGMAYIPRGFRLIRDHRELWVYVVAQVALSALLLIAGPWLALGQSERITRAIWTPTLDASLMSRLLAGLHSGLEIVVAVLLVATGILAAATLGAALASPINDLLSERVEALMTRAPFTGQPMAAVVREALRVMALSLVRAGVYLVMMAGAAVLAWGLPGVGHVIQVAVSVTLTLAYLSLDQVDYAAARRGWSVAQRLRLLGEHPMRMFGFGAGVWLCLCVPLLNVVFMPVSVAGGTLLVLELQRAPRLA